MIKRWPAISLRQCWASYWRSLLGVEGFAKNRVERAISFRVKEVGEERADYLENFIPAEETEEQPSFASLSREEQALRLLLEAGFDRLECQRVFRLTGNEFKARLSQLREKIVREEPDLADQIKRMKSQLDWFESKAFRKRRHAEKTPPAISLEVFETLMRLSDASRVF